MVIKSGGYLWLLSTWKFVHVWTLHGFDLVKKHRQITTNNLCSCWYEPRYVGIDVGLTVCEQIIEIVFCGYFVFSSMR
jgi:hypothetical protein